MCVKSFIPVDCSTAFIIYTNIFPNLQSYPLPNSSYSEVPEIFQSRGKAERETSRRREVNSEDLMPLFFKMQNSLLFLGRL